MTTWAVIPVKRLLESKRRLAHLLAPQARAELIANFLDNLLSVLNDSPGIDRVLVVTDDPAVMRIAERHGAMLLVEENTAGLNAAVAAGAGLAAGSGATAMLVLPADLPFVRVEDIEEMLDPLAGRQFTSADGRPQTTDHGAIMALTGDETEEGTNALLLAPPGDFNFHYGPGSFQAHLDEARARGRIAHIIDAPGLQFDLDTESDWLVYNGYLMMIADD